VFVLCTLNYYHTSCGTVLILPYHTTLYHTIPYHTIPYHTIPHHVHHTIPHHTIPDHTTLYHTKPKRNLIILYYIVKSHSKVPVSMASKDILSSSSCVGADTLLKLLGNYCRSKDIKTSITVGVVGNLQQ